MSKSVLVHPVGFLALAAAILLSFSAHAMEHPSWWPAAVDRAQEQGYQMIGHEELERLAESKKGVILDVRPEYEFEAGHIPGAHNLEFDLGDRQELSADKKKQLQTLLGKDKERPVVIYCRSFR